MVTRYDIHLCEVAAQTTAVVRRKAQISGLSTAIPNGCEEVRKFLRARGLSDTGREIVYYTSSDEHLNLEVEIGLEVDQPFEGDEHIFCSSLPSGFAVMGTLFGEYVGITGVHISIRLWCLEHGYEHDEICWELYGEHSNEPEKLRTDVYYLLSNKK